MKKLLGIFFLLLLNYTLKAQGYPISQSIGSDSTLVTSKGALKSRLINYSYTDTIQANTQRIKQYPGAQIFTTSDSNMWYRTPNANKWVQFFTNRGGTTGDTLVWKQSGNYVADRVVQPVLGTKTFTELPFITNDTTRMTIGVNGIRRTSSAQYKYVMIDTASGGNFYLAYGDGGSGSSYTSSNGITLTGSNFKLGGTLVDATTTINGGGNDFIFNNIATWNVNATEPSNISTTSGGLTGTLTVDAGHVDINSATAAGFGQIRVEHDSIHIEPPLGRLKIDTINYTLSTTGKKIMLRDTATGLVQNIDASLIGGGGTPAGNFGNVQIGRNGAFDTPGSDSLDFDGGLVVKGTGSYTGDVTITKAGASIILDATAGTYGEVRIDDSGGFANYISGVGGLQYSITNNAYSHNFYQGGTLIAQMNNLSVPALIANGRLAITGLQSSGASQGIVEIGRTIPAATNHRGFRDGTIFDDDDASSISYAGFDGDVTMRVRNGRTAGHIAVHQARGTKDSSGTLNDWFDFVSATSTFSDGVVGTKYGFRYYEPSVTGSGVLGAQTGIYIPALSAATGRNRAAIFEDSITIADGTQGDGKVLTSNANGDASWQTPSAGTPAGNFGNLQINRNGAFATPASDSLDFESATGLTVKGNITSSTLTSGRITIAGTAGLLEDDAGFTYSKTNNAFSVEGLDGDIAGWSTVNSTGFSSTSTTAPGIRVFNGGAAYLYGMNLGYFGGYGLNMVTGDGTSFFWTRGGGALYSNFSRAMTLNGDNELLINTSTDNGAYNLQVAGSARIAGNLDLPTAGNKINIATGSNASVGVSGAMTAGSITISTTAVTANSKIFLTHASVAGTQGILSVGTITAATSFVINSSNAADTGTVNWFIIN